MKIYKIDTVDLNKNISKGETIVKMITLEEFEDYKYKVDLIRASDKRDLKEKILKEIDGIYFVNSQWDMVKIVRKSEIKKRIIKIFEGENNE